MHQTHFPKHFPFIHFERDKQHVASWRGEKVEKTIFVKKSALNKQGESLISFDVGWKFKQVVLKWLRVFPGGNILLRVERGF